MGVAILQARWCFILPEEDAAYLEALGDVVMGVCRMQSEKNNDRLEYVCNDERLSISDCESS